MTCMASVELAADDDGVVRLPLTSVYAPVGGDDYVWVVDDDNRVVRRKVRVEGLINGNDVAIRGDVDVGDRVVVAGVYKLSDGERVTIIK
jgi:multidrug efflux pump subunit AcrA (membrane-fusion protein)